MPASILVVDDEADLELLVLHNFRHRIASGELAFQFAANGHEALRVLREHPETRDIPILIFTVKDLSGEERGRLRGSVQGVVTKGAAGDLLRELARVMAANGRRGDMAAEERG